ncbi:hypothetical protein GOARA_029_00160 [Gordonia araii NBRC 100433]|uniref:(d)CMP kinase n=1 Tax=Gordonia araii NBRC 100433 TaxID=1073574 RepID=G7GZX7_9ACTN|nr:hypothetical protein [Gordonia araii]NNG99173.1 hypothetical protein [Gordonia araii NBRC 100433]GAB09152.1 hypothetical protein GOARA_029_00160 [Gordonia araii NBRC 100433]
MAETSVVEVASTLAAGIVAVDGPSGSGKSTFAAALVARLAESGRDALLVSTDEFATWDDPVAWWPELVEGVLMPFRAGADLRYRPRVWEGGAAVVGPEIHRVWRPILVVEGVSSARRAMTPHLDRALWLDGGSPEQRLEAAVAREGEQAREHLVAWQRFEEGWFAVDRTRERCEVVSPS